MQTLNTFITIIGHVNKKNNRSELWSRLLTFKLPYWIPSVTFFINSLIKKYIHRVYAYYYYWDIFS